MVISHALPVSPQNSISTQHIRHGRMLAALLHRTLVMEPVLSLCNVPGIPGPWHLDAENSFWRTHEEEQGLHVRQRPLWRSSRLPASWEGASRGHHRTGRRVPQSPRWMLSPCWCSLVWLSWNSNYSITQGSVLLVLEEFYEPNGSNALSRPNGHFHADTHEQVPLLPHQSHNVNIALAASYDMHHLSSMNWKQFIGCSVTLGTIGF